MDGVVEDILARSDVKDVFRWKSVCKSWYKLISSNYFVKAHLKRSYNNNRKHGDIRIRLHWQINTKADDGKSRCFKMVGSCNGLVCISTGPTKFLVTNPSTREVRKLPYFPNSCNFWEKRIWGFGYDSTTDDYKVVVGFNEYSSHKFHMMFQVLSLKSNKWKFVRDDANYLTYRAQGQIRDLPGVLFNGALHWLVDDTNEKKKVILSFDLSLEKCKEIPQPNDDSYSCDDRTILRMFNECLCISGFYDIHTNTSDDNGCRKIWVMKNYNSWQLVRSSDDYECKKYGFDATTVYPLDIFLDKTWRFNDGDVSWASWFDTVYPIFVKSLVSPYIWETIESTSDKDQGRSHWDFSFLRGRSNHFKQLGIEWASKDIKEE